MLKTSVGRKKVSRESTAKPVAKKSATKSRRVSKSKEVVSRQVVREKPLVREKSRGFDLNKIIVGGLLGVIFLTSVYLALSYFQGGEVGSAPPMVKSATGVMNSCDKNKVIANLEKCSVAIGSDNYHFGSGFVVKDGLVLTAAHVVSGAETLHATQGENSVLAEVVATSADLDLALLKLAENKLGFEPCIISEEENLAPLTALYATGWPYGSLNGGVSFTNGHLSRYFESSGSSYLQVDINTLPGNSGGPVASDCGVVGINTFRLTFENYEENATAVYQGFDMALPSKDFMGWVEAQI